MLSLLLSLISSISYDGENIFYVSDTNFSDVINKFPASILLVQQGTDNERFRYMSDFINAAPLLMTRCFFVIMNGDRSKNFVEKVHLVHTKGYYFFRYGNLIEEYTGDTNSDAITKYALEKTGLAFTAFQDYPLAQDFIESHGAINPVETMTKEELAQLPIRKLTPEEAFMLQGFPASFASKGRAAGVADGSLYKQAGNAVSINTIYAVLYYLIANNIIHE